MHSKQASKRHRESEREREEPSTSCLQESKKEREVLRSIVFSFMRILGVILGHLSQMFSQSGHRRSLQCQRGLAKRLLG